MAWNRQETNKDKSVEKPALVRGVMAGLVVAVGAGVAAWFIFGGGKMRRAEKTGTVKPTQIAEVAPQISTNVPVKVQAAEEGPKELPPQRIGETRDGKILLPNGRLHPVKGVITNYSGLAKRPYQIFSRSSENIIAGLLTIQPGQTLVGTPRYNGRFTKDFLESLKEPIIETADDSEYNRELKKMVREAKIELKAAYDRGEDIEKIIGDARKELQDLGRYKQELKTMAIQGLNTAATAEEMDDVIAAANRMLEEKGIAPLENLTPLAKIKLRMKEEKELKK